MDIKLNIIIFSIGSMVRKSNRNLDDKKLKILLQRNEKEKLVFPTFSFSKDKDILDTIKENTKQILKSKTIYFEQLYTWGETKYYTDDNGLTISYLAIVNENESNLKSNDHEWYTIDIDDLNNNPINKTQKFTLSNDINKYEYTLKTIRNKTGITLSYTHEFDNNCVLDYNHSIILITALKRIRSNIEYTDLAFKFLSDTFTLTELQQVYEIVLGHSLDKGNFRKKIAKMVEETDEIKKDSAHRPAKYFKLNANWIKDYV
jgi:hypothetical protein